MQQPRTVPELRAARARLQAGALAEAEAICQRLHAAAPEDGAVLLLWAQVRRRFGDQNAAVALLERAVAAGAGAAGVLELASCRIEQGALDAAEQLLRQAPAEARALLLLGRIGEARGQRAEAAACYRQAVRADARLLPARLALARVLAALGHVEEAIAAYAAALAHAPDNVDALLGLGWAYGRQRRFHEALGCFDRAEKRGAEIAGPLAEVVQGFAHVCDWSERAALRRRLLARVRRPPPCVIDPYALLFAEDDPAALQQLGLCLAGAVAAQVTGLPRPAQRNAAGAGGRIRVGYLSADFNQHATALLMAEVFERHDRGRFEISAYCYSRDDGSPMRRRLLAAFDHFVPLGLEPPVASARRIAADGIDILVDLKGYTEGARPEIPALRPAPIQVSHLGYPATLGAPWMDYVLADAVVLPFAEQPHWQERIVHLPHCYQPNDRKRPLPPPADRATLGLPRDGFVFACFNNSYKITPEMFGLWMDILAETPGSVLWLHQSNDFMPRYLREAAHARGIAVERLVFAPPAEYSAHLARHAAADLFLDTAPYGAHTTGSDALWAGLPLLACQGRCFASRVAASLLHAVGLPELVAGSPDEYRALALRLAREPALLTAYRAHLLRARDHAPLFDAARFTRNLEAAYTEMMERRQRGQAPAGFAVQEPAQHG
jgi:predicted O-linked N-acetylglucosamine transferase (SPINDLY family)